MHTPAIHMLAIHMLAIPTLAILCAFTSAQASAADLAKDTQQAAAAAGLGASLAYSVMRVDDGAVLASSNAQLPFKPASNLKVFTSGAALAELGPEFRFRTSLVLDEKTGRLTIVGDGDPALGDPKVLERLAVADAKGNAKAGVTASQLVGWWADLVTQSGVRELRELVVDARMFDTQCYNPTWPTDQRSRPYCAEVWGFNFHANMLLLGAHANGGSVTVDRFEPNYAWTIDRNTAQVGAAKSKSTFVVTRDATSNALRVSGKLPKGTRADVDLSMHETPSLFGELLARDLRSRGIAVASSRMANAQDAAATGTTLGVIETPIAVVLERTNTDSANLYAESLLKRLGAARSNNANNNSSVGPTWIAGSWANGTRALEATVTERIGALASGFVFADGCGLSHSNRITAAGTAAWLCSIASDARLRQCFLESMAIAGETGTVKDRFASLKQLPQNAGIEVRCKTGYINGVSTLSGVVSTSDGRRIAFSVLANNLEKVGTDRARKAQEAIVGAIGKSLASERSAPNATVTTSGSSEERSRVEP